MIRFKAQPIEDYEITKSIAEEMAQVGIIPSEDDSINVGDFCEIAGQKFMVMGKCNRQEFLEAVANANLPGLLPEDFSTLPEDISFYKISTD